MSQHAPISISGLELTVACPASVKLQAAVPPQPETEEEAEGTAAHFVAMRYAQGRARELPVGAKFTVNGREWTVDLDMATGAELYARALGGLHNTLRLEETVKCSRIHPTQCWGTPDAWRYLPDYVFPQGLGLPEHPVNVVRVGDYKYGHRFVEVFECLQLIGYAAGVMELLGLHDENVWLEFILVQPRSYHKDGPVRIWRVRADKIRALINICYNAAHEALGDNPTARTSEHCLDCRARHACKTLQQCTQTLVDFSTSAELVQLPPEAMGQELAIIDDALERLKARRTGLAAQAEALLRMGKSIAFYHMEPGQSRLIYKDDVTVDEILGLGELLGLELRKPQNPKDALLTPTQAIQRGVDEEVMKQYSHRPPAGLKLARDNSILARKVFSK